MLVMYVKMIELSGENHDNNSIGSLMSRYSTAVQYVNCTSGKTIAVLLSS